MRPSWTRLSQSDYAWRGYRGAGQTGSPAQKQFTGTEHAIHDHVRRADDLEVR